MNEGWLGVFVGPNLRSLEGTRVSWAGAAGATGATDAFDVGCTTFGALAACHHYVRLSPDGDIKVTIH
jgi:hypothetical protein